MLYIWIYVGVLVVMSLVAFAAYGLDKRKAARESWRTPERTLLLLAFLGGGFGALIGMRVFHHKTRKPKLQILVPLFLVLQVLGLILLLKLQLG